MFFLDLLDVSYLSLAFSHVYIFRNLIVLISESTTYFLINCDVMLMSTCSLSRSRWRSTKSAVEKNSNQRISTCVARIDTSSYQWEDILWLPVKIRERGECFSRTESSKRSSTFSHFVVSASQWWCSSYPTLGRRSAFSVQCGSSTV